MRELEKRITELEDQVHSAPLTQLKSISVRNEEEQTVVKRILTKSQSPSRSSSHHVQSSKVSNIDKKNMSLM